MLDAIRKRMHVDHMHGPALVTTGDSLLSRISNPIVVLSPGNTLNYFAVKFTSGCIDSSPCVSVQIGARFGLCDLLRW